MEGTIGGQNKILMAVLAILIGGLGIHCFMMGETKKGIVRLLANLLFLGGLLGIIDGIMILTNNYKVNPDSWFF